MKSKTFATIMLTILALGSLNLDASARTYRRGYRSSAMVPAGSTVSVRLDSQISTENASQGDSWNGTVVQSTGNIPAGSPVSGVVTTAVQGTHNTRPQIGLAVRRVNVNGRSYVMNADSPVIVAGTSRAKKLGAIAIGAGAGALLGHTVAKGNHGTLIGGIVGGAAGYGLTRHALRTMQLKSGTVVSFTTREDVLASRGY
jgi:hypothetical protein